MCFCANVSFAASAGLAAIGTATLIWRSRPEERFLTATPLWFAGQQAIEGLLWTQLHGDDPTGPAVMSLTTTYLFFALFWWPAYTSFGAFWMEPPGPRRRILAGMTLAGLIVGAFLFGSYLIDPAPATIVNRSISHSMARPGVVAFTGLYILISLSVGVVSSCRRVKLFYLLFALSTVGTLLWYRETFTSVWCFFAAILSALLWFNPRPKSTAA